MEEGCSFETSVPVRTALFWVITQRVVVIPRRRFGTTYRSHLQGSRRPIVFSRNDCKFFFFFCKELQYSSLRYSPGDNSSCALRGGMLKPSLYPCTALTNNADARNVHAPNLIYTSCPAGLHAFTFLVCTIQFVLRLMNYKELNRKFGFIIFPGMP